MAPLELGIGAVSFDFPAMAASRNIFFSFCIADGDCSLVRNPSKKCYLIIIAFRLIGSKIAVCLRDEWSEPPPLCVSMLNKVIDS